MAFVGTDTRAGGTGLATEGQGGIGPVPIAVGLTTLIGVYLWLLVPYIAAGDGIFDSTGHVFGRDFINIWTAGRLGLEDKLDIIYDRWAYSLQQNAYLGRDFPRHAWSYPPNFLPFALPFGSLPYLPALAIWTLATGALLLLAARAWGVRGLGLVMLALSPAVAINAVGGQNGALSAAILLAGLHQLDRRPLVAGVLFGCMAYKPHLAVLLPVALLVAGRWRAIVSAAATVAGLVLVSFALYGVDPWHVYITDTAPFHAGLLRRGDGGIPLMMPGAFMAARLLGLLEYAGYVQAVFSAFAVAAAAWAWRRPDEPALRAAILLAAAPLAVPYAFNYDLTTVAAAAMLAVIRFRGGIDPFLVGSGVAVCLLPGAVIVLNAARLPLGPLLLAAFVLALLAALERKRRAGRRPLTLPAGRCAAGPR